MAPETWARSERRNFVWHTLGCLEPDPWRQELGQGRSIKSSLSWTTLHPYFRNDKNQSLVTGGFLSLSRTGREAQHQDPSSQLPPQLVLFLPVWWIKVSHTVSSTCVYSPGINPCKWLPLKTFSPLVSSALLLPHLTDFAITTASLLIFGKLQGQPASGSLCLLFPCLTCSSPNYTPSLTSLQERSPTSLLTTYSLPPQSARLPSTMHIYS